MIRGNPIMSKVAMINFILVAHLSFVLSLTETLRNIFKQIGINTLKEVRICESTKKEQ